MPCTSGCPFSVARWPGRILVIKSLKLIKESQSFFTFTPVNATGEQTKVKKVYIQNNAKYSVVMLMTFIGYVLFREAAGILLP